MTIIKRRGTVGSVRILIYPPSTLVGPEDPRILVSTMVIGFLRRIKDYVNRGVVASKNFESSSYHITLKPTSKQWRPQFPL